MLSERKLRVLIVDDEALARLRLADLVQQEPGAEIVGTAVDGAAAIEAIRALRPDLVLLDVQMPEKTGLEVVHELGAEMPATIFVTAFDRFAIEAFEVAAVDYLVKPYDDDRLLGALRRARRRLELEGMDLLRDRLLSVLHGHSATATGPSTSAMAPTTVQDVPGPSLAPASAASTIEERPPYLERIAVEIRGTVRPIPVSAIESITASGVYAELHVSEGAGLRRYVIREAIQVLEQRLDPARFMRVHRSIIVRLDRVETLHRGVGRNCEVELKGGRRLRVSRSRLEVLERWLGIA